MATTLLSLRTQAKQQSDNVNSSFISDDEWNGYIQSSYLELYGNIVQHFGNEYFVQPLPGGYLITTDGLTQYYSLPADFFKLLGVDLQISAPNYWVNVKYFPFPERNRLSITNSTIPAAGQVLRIFYVPRATVPVADSDTIDGVNGWEEFIVIDACIKALAKEESDVSVFMARREKMETRLTSEIENRDASGSGVVADVRGRRTRAMQYSLWGGQLWLIGSGQPGWAPMGDFGGDVDYWPSW